ncbi:MAG: polymer-forming cytoskeletal protein [Bryobacterales bacterium]|nr:polymer-forming cytoskeletal protein [Acidobacteriota bacterium]MCB9383839.1 polymer-forming cytoskeletal protein [Bryobacterales bacterium]
MSTNNDLPNAAQGGGYISRSLKVSGSVTGSGDLYIDGTLDGQIDLADRRVTIGEAGVVTAEVQAGEIRVMGSLEGVASAAERIEVAQTGSVEGEVTTKRIKIEEGARFEGSVKISGMRKQGEKKSPGRVTVVPAAAKAV